MPAGLIADSLRLRGSTQHRLSLDSVLKGSTKAMECLDCDWDPRKDIENQRKHGGIRFAEACCVFRDPNHSEAPDDRDYDEDRWIAAGLVGRTVLVVAFTERNNRQRINTARKALSNEEAAYYARFA